VSGIIIYVPGGIAQLGERFHGMEEVTRSNRAISILGSSIIYEYLQTGFIDLAEAEFSKKMREAGLWIRIQKCYRNIQAVLL
jgi:hypothetical protein